jgi:ABC-type lipoprotein release transport system permease subunit
MVVQKHSIITELQLDAATTDSTVSLVLRSPIDPLSYVAAMGLLALIAILLPARRAVKVEPMVALRE